jgi:hypothetical protein
MLDFGDVEEKTEEWREDKATTVSYFVVGVNILLNGPVCGNAWTYSYA